MAPSTSLPEVWLRGPVEGVHPALMPAAHALLQVVEDLERVAGGLSGAEIRATPNGAASIAFHLRHIAGSIDRLTTYARGEVLSHTQRATLLSEKELADGKEPPALVEAVV